MTNRMIAAVSLMAVSTVLFGAAGNGCESAPNESADRFSAAETPQNIVNGEETGYQEFKGVIAVVFGSVFCSGTLVDPEVIVTAGHCIYKPSEGRDLTGDPSSLDILGGTEPNLLYYSTVTEAVKHPLWDGNSGNDPKADIAMLHLTKAVTSVESYGIRKSPALKNGEDTMLVGYGRPVSDGVSGTHRKGVALIRNVNFLQDAFETEGPAFTCSGDSGGACLSEASADEWQLAGVLSAGNCETGSLVINALTYYDWIDATMTDFVGYGLDGPDTDTETETDTQGADTDTGSAADDDDDDDDNDNNYNNDNNNDNNDDDDNDDSNGPDCKCRIVRAYGSASSVSTFFQLFL